MSGQTTNEEGFLVQRLVRDGLGSGWVESRDGWLPDAAQARTLARPDLAARVSDIDHADAILVVGTELVDEAPILDLRVRKAVRRNGARLVTAVGAALHPRRGRRRRGAPRPRRGGGGTGRPGRRARIPARRRRRSTTWPAAPAPWPASGPAPRARTAAPPSAADAVRAAADVLRDAGDVVVLWGERLWAGERGRQAVDALLAVAGALGLPDKAESGLIGIPESTNGRGLREVGCLPGDRPRPGRRARARRARGATGALLLVDADQAPESVLERAGLRDRVRALPQRRARGARRTWCSRPRSTPRRRAPSRTRTGRIQRVRQALGHAGEVRPGWSVLGELCERLGAGTAPLSAARR